MRRIDPASWKPSTGTRFENASPIFHAHEGGGFNSIAGFFANAK